MLPEAIILAFVFAFGACVGSFLNVVVWRLPRGQSLVTPPSACPKCGHRLAWYDNVPVLGWLLLRGKCRYCRAPISGRYPTIEALTGLLFVFYYVALFDLQLGPCTSAARPLTVRSDWAVWALWMFMLSGLLAASLIDGELFIIPLEIPWLMAAVGVVSHAMIDRPGQPGAVAVSGPAAGALAAGGLLGWLMSLAAMRLGVLRRSFPNGEPLLDVDREAVVAEAEEARRRGEPAPAVPPAYSRGQVTGEMMLEVLFLLPALVLSAGFALLVLNVELVGRWWASVSSPWWMSGVLGAVLGALVGGLIVWVTRILGTLAFGRVAMGLGDVHLMFGVGAVVGAGPVTVAFFLAPFAGMAIALYLLLFGKRREIPYGPYLSLGTAVTLLFYCPIARWLAPGLSGLGQWVRSWVSGPA